MKRFEARMSRHVSVMVRDGRRRTRPTLNYLAMIGLTASLSLAQTAAQSANGATDGTARTGARDAALREGGAVTLTASRSQEPLRHGQSRERTYCNPIDLPYRFAINGMIPWREAADPAMIVFRGEYWLFPSKTGGYFHSKDLLHWSFVEAHGYSAENYAPTALVMDNKVYLTSGEGNTKLWVTDDPASGNWTTLADFGTALATPTSSWTTTDDSICMTE